MKMEKSAKMEDLVKFVNLYNWRGIEGFSFYFFALICFSFDGDTECSY